MPRLPRERLTTAHKGAQKQGADLFLHRCPGLSQPVPLVLGGSVTQGKVEVARGDTLLGDTLRVLV